MSSVVSDIKTELCLWDYWQRCVGKKICVTWEPTKGIWEGHRPLEGKERRWRWCRDIEDWPGREVLLRMRWGACVLTAHRCSRVLLFTVWCIAVGARVEVSAVLSRLIRHGSIPSGCCCHLYPAMWDGQWVNSSVFFCSSIIFIDLILQYECYFSTTQICSQSGSEGGNSQGTHLFNCSKSQHYRYYNNHFSQC